MLSLADVEAFMVISRALENASGEALSEQEHRFLRLVAQTVQPSAAAMFGFPVAAPALAHNTTDGGRLRRVCGARG